MALLPFLLLCSEGRALPLDIKPTLLAVKSLHFHGSRNLLQATGGDVCGLFIHQPARPTNWMEPAIIKGVVKVKALHNVILELGGKPEEALHNWAVNP